MKIEGLEKLFEGIPRKKLCFLPTPFHKLENLSKKYGTAMYIKRDELTGPGVFGGNKMRKVEFILGSGLEKGIEYYISTGGYQTNAGLELTTGCRICGVKPILYLGDTVRQGVPKEYKANLLLNKIMDCEIHYVDRLPSEDVGTTMRRCLEMGKRRKEALEREGHKAMTIPAGVVAPEGLVSYVLGFKEIIEQSKEMKVNLDYLFHTTGTGGSLPGLLAGKFLLESNIKIISVAISPPVATAREEEICDRTEETFRRLGVNPPSREGIIREINIEWNFAGEDYGVPSKEGTEAIKELAREEGLLVDSVYSGKGFAGFLDYIRSGKIPKGSKAAFLHTGGIGALFAEEELTGKLWD